MLPPQEEEIVAETYALSLKCGSFLLNTIFHVKFARRVKWLKATTKRQTENSCEGPALAILKYPHPLRVLAYLSKANCGRFRQAKTIQEGV